MFVAVVFLDTRVSCRVTHAQYDGHGRKYAVVRTCTNTVDGVCGPDNALYFCVVYMLAVKLSPSSLIQGSSLTPLL